MTEHLRDSNNEDLQALEKSASSQPRIHPRRENRMLAVQFLYSWELSHPENLDQALMHFFAEQGKKREYCQFAEMLVKGTIEHVNELDALIQEYAQNWAFSRIAKVDLSILRLALYELKFRNDIPPIVSINEALDLAGVFSHLDSKRFINGILDRFKATLTRPFRTAAQ